MARTAWTLTDNSTGSPVVLSFDINPKEAEYPGREANLTQEYGTSPNSQPIIFQGRNSLPTFSFTAVVRGETNYADMQTWVNKWYPLVLEDDLGNTWTVLFRSASFRRQNRHIQPWSFEMQATMTVLT